MLTLHGIARATRYVHGRNELAIRHEKKTLRVACRLVGMKVVISIHSYYRKDQALKIDIVHIRIRVFNIQTFSYHTISVFGYSKLIFYPNTMNINVQHIIITRLDDVQFTRYTELHQSFSVYYKHCPKLN
jgi:hypothetical protein